MAKTIVPIEVAIDGVSGVSGSVYVPIMSMNDIHGGFQEPTTPKLGNDPAVDITTRLSTYPIIKDLSGGAWQKFFDPNQNAYFEPALGSAINSGNINGASTPLAWTANPEAPLMPGCANTDKSGSYAFGQIVYYNGRLYGLDVKNNKVWKSNSGLTTIATTDTSASGSGNVTELALSPNSSRLYLGRSAGNARYWDGATWTDYTKAAQHFCAVGKNWFYSAARTVKWENNETTWAVAVGLPDTNINCLLYWKTYILVGKPEGVFAINVRNKNTDQIFYSNDQNTNNCRFLTLHGNTVFFASGEGFFEYDGNNVLPKNFAQFDGNANRFFYGGKVLNAYSDGRNLWLAFQVQTSDNTPYYNTFIVLMTPRKLGFHPIYVTSSTTNPSYIPAGLFFINQKLHYSLGNDVGGYLLTDGAVPMSASGSPYTWDVGITTGWANMSRDWITKWLYGVRISTKDQGTTSRYDLSYMKWTDTSWKDFPTPPTGTNDNTLVQPTAETVAGNPGRSGFVTTKVNTKIILHNTGNSTAQESAAAVQSLHWVGTPMYTDAIQVQVTAYLDLQEPVENEVKQRTYIGSTILAQLITATKQNTPVTLTMPDGTSYLGTLEPVGGGISYESMDTDGDNKGAPKVVRFTFLFTEFT